MGLAKGHSHNPCHLQSYNFSQDTLACYLRFAWASPKEQRGYLHYYRSDN